MTKANAKVLYNHFVTKGMDKEAKDILKHNPEFAHFDKAVPKTPKSAVKPVARSDNRVKKMRRNQIDEPSEPAIADSTDTSTTDQTAPVNHLIDAMEEAE